MIHRCNAKMVLSQRGRGRLSFERGGSSGRNFGVKRGLGYPVQLISTPQLVSNAQSGWELECSIGENWGWDRGGKRTLFVWHRPVLPNGRPPVSVSCPLDVQSCRLGNYSLKLDQTAGRNSGTSQPLSVLMSREFQLPTH